MKVSFSHLSSSLILPSTNTLVPSCDLILLSLLSGSLVALIQAGLLSCSKWSAPVWRALAMLISRWCWLGDEKMMNDLHSKWLLQISQDRFSYPTHARFLSVMKDWVTIGGMKRWTVLAGIQDSGILLILDSGDFLGPSTLSFPRFWVHTNTRSFLHTNSNHRFFFAIHLSLTQ